MPMLLGRITQCCHDVDLQKRSSVGIVWLSAYDLILAPWKE